MVRQAIKASTEMRGTFALMIYACVAIPYPAALMGYHIFLMARGETTRELLNSRKFIKAERHRPFNIGSWWRNIAAVLCRPRPPSYIETKKAYHEGDQRFEQEVEMKMLNPGLPEIPDTRPVTAVSTTASGRLGTGRESLGRVGSMV